MRFRTLALLFLVSAPVLASLGAPVPLTITDHSGVARANEGVTTGVPIPSSANVLDVRNLMLTTSSAGACSGGSTVDSMLHVVERWNGAPTDVTKPIRWVWVETLVPSLAANASVVYCLKDRVGADPGTTSLTVTNTGGFITVNTGAMTFKVSTTVFNFLDTVTVGSTTVVTSSAANTWKVVANGVTYDTSHTDSSYAATVEYPGVANNANSAGENIRAQIKVSGKFTSSGAAQKFLYEMRILAYAGGTGVTVRPVLTFSEDMFATTNKPTAITMSLPLALGGGTRTYTYGANTGTTTGTMTSGDDVYLLQYDHGHGTPTGLAGYTVVKNGTSTGADNHQAQGWADINDGTNGATVWVRDFWQRYPMELEVSGSTLNVHLWPTHGATGVSGVGDGTSPLAQIFVAKRDAALSATTDAMKHGAIWPYSGSAEMDLTPIAPNLMRAIYTVTKGATTAISAGLATFDSGGGGFCTTQANPSCHYWPSGTTQRVYLRSFTGCWAAINGYHTATFNGTFDGIGLPIISLDADTSACSLPVTNPLNAGTSNDPTISNIDTQTDMQAQGTAEEWEIKYQFYAGAVPTAANTAAALKDRLMLVNPAWLASSQAFGRIKEVDTAEFPLAEANIVKGWNALTFGIDDTNIYGAMNYGDFFYDPASAPGGFGTRWWAFSRKGWELVPWMMYARTGDPQYLNWATAITSHGINVDLQHVNVSLYTDANNNRVIKRVGGGVCTHGTTHWYPVYSMYTGSLRTDGGAFDCSEGAEPTLDYVAESAEAMYVFTAHDRSKQIALEQLAHVQYTDAALDDFKNVISSRQLGGCLTLATTANRLAWTGMTLAEKCFASAVNHPDNTSSLGNPVGFIQGDRYGNEIDWGYFQGSWTSESFAKYAEQDPAYCANDAASVSHCVLAEFLRFTKASSGMGKTSDTTGLFYYGPPFEALATAYASTSDDRYLKYTQRIFQQYYQPLTYILGANNAVGVFGRIDVHYWPLFMRNIPFAEALLSGRTVAQPDNAPYPVTIPSDGTHFATFLVNKPTDQSWTFTFSVDTWDDMSGGIFPLSGTVTVDVLKPSGASALHTTVSACTYLGPTPCIPNSWSPIESNSTTVGHGMSVTYGGVDNRVLTFTVPGDGLTGEYTIKLSVANGVGGTCNGDANDRYTCYTARQFAFPMGTSLGNMTLVNPATTDIDCSSDPQTPHVGRGMYYFNVPSGTAQIKSSTSVTNSFLLSPSGLYYGIGTTSTVAPEPGMWALGTNSQSDDGWGAGECVGIKGVKPLLAASPQVYYDSPNQSITSAISDFGANVTVNFSGVVSLVVTPTTLSYVCVAGVGNPSDQTIGVSAINTTLDQWTASKGQAWLTISPTSNTVAGNITAAVSCSGKAAGTYTDTISVSSTTAGIVNSPQTVAVSLVVTSPGTPLLTVSPPSFTFPCISGGGDPATQAVTIGAVNTTLDNWSATKGQTWLTLSPSSGSAAGTLTVGTTGCGALSVSTHTDTISIASTTTGITNTPQTVAVSLVVSAPSIALTASPVSMGFACTASGNNPSAQTLMVGSTGGTLDNWSTSNTQGWLSGAASGSGTWPALFGSFPVSVNCTGLSAGSYSDTISVASTTTGVGNSPLSVPVSLTVYSAPTVMTSVLANGTVGALYSQTLSATGGQAGYTWGLAAGSLCDGLTLFSGGVIGGTPTTAQTCNFTVRVTEAGGAVATRPLSILVPSKAMASVSGAPAVSGVTNH